jgi:hypothetical protein
MWRVDVYPETVIESIGTKQVQTSEVNLLKTV